MKIIISCNKIALALFYLFLLLEVVLFSFLTVDNSNKIVLKNEEERILFLKSNGFNNVEILNSPKEVSVPINQTNDYKKYLNQLKNCGWELYKFSGKEVKIHSYKNSQAVVNLFFYNNVLVGGDFCEFNGGETKPLLIKNEN